MFVPRRSPVALAVALLWSGCGSPTPPVPAASIEEALPQTVVLFIGCTFRADRTTVHSPQQGTTPYLAALAKTGTHFEHMLSNSAWTRPGVGGAVTGVHPLVMGLDEGGRETLGRAISPEVVTLAERMKAAGYTTVGVTGNPNANPVFGFDQGFDVYQGTEKLYRDGQPHLPGTMLIDNVLDAAKDVDGPLFVQVVLVDAHSPWEMDAMAQIQAGNWWPSSHERDRYDASLRKLDDALAHLDQRLAEMGRSNRLLVVTGDHAEGLKTPRWASRGHGNTLYDAHVHIPWVLHGPGVAQGHRVDGLARSIDVVPTIGGLLGWEPDPSLKGTDQSSAVRGETQQSGTHRVFTTSRIGPGDLRRITTDDWTFIKVRKVPRRRYKRGPEELYRSDDRRQKTDVHSEHPEITHAMGLEADQTWYALRDRRLVVEVDPSEADIDHLRALGYLDE